MSTVSGRPFSEGLLAILALEDGTIFRGFSIGAPGHAAGEVVFNTALTGYQEILTDPSYSRQIVTLTYPHIGNTGVNLEDTEADRVHAAGLIIKDLPQLASNFRSTRSLSDYLKSENIVGIAGIDVRTCCPACRSTVCRSHVDEAKQGRSGWPRLLGSGLRDIYRLAHRGRGTRKGPRSFVLSETQRLSRTKCKFRRVGGGG